MKHKSILSAMLLTVILSLAVIPPASSQPVAMEELVLAEVEEPLAKHAYATDHVLVQLQPDAQLASSSENNLNALYADLGVHGTQAVFPVDHAQQVMRLNLAPNSDIETTVAQLEQNPNVLWAEPDYLAYAADTTPNDPEFASQWGLTQIDAPAAWDVVTGTQGTVIAVLDSGMDLTHEDLTAKLWVNPGEVAGNGIDDDNNGFIDDVNGWDFVYDDNDPSDDNGHGTQVAGITAAITNNATGMAGVCWGCRIMLVKVMQVSGVANYSDIAAGVIYAAKKGADVINLSLGGYYDSSTLSNAIQSAVDNYGAIVIAGAGNDNKSSKFYPAAYDEVLAVAGTDSSDVKVSSSNYGTWVDVSAPGENITAPFLGGGYGPVNGTSYATPFASGLAGLIHSQNPDWSPELIQAQIVKTSEEIDSVNPSYAGQLGSGRINANLAVTTAPHPILTLDSTAVDGDLSGRPTAGTESDLEVTITNDWLDATNVQGVLSSTDPLVTIATNTADFGSVDAGAIATNSPVYQFTVDTSAGYNYDIAFDLALSANSGSYTTNIPITITTRSANEPVGPATIAADTTWTSDKTYLVNGNIGVAPGYTLTIEAGTTILFNGNYTLNVGGTLVARGTESAPIVFAANEGVDTWDGISFADSAMDASVDAQDAYVSGNILEWVEISGSGNDTSCTNATPYINHLTSRDSGINCAPGDLDRNGTVISNFMLLYNSSLHGAVAIAGHADVIENQLYENLTISGSSYVLTNTIANGISTGSGFRYSIIQNNTLTSGNISCRTDTHVYSNTLLAGNISSGESGPDVKWNKLKSGGIHLGSSATVHANDIEYADGWGISATSSVTITENRLVGNTNGISLQAGVVQGNLVANGGIGIAVSGNTEVISNTFTGNNGTSMKITGNPTLLSIYGNNFEGNNNTYDIENLVPKATLPMIIAQNNWWGTTDPAEIDLRIYDFMDGDFTLGQVLYAPVATSPITDAPAYVRIVNMFPDNVVGIETATFEVEFSKEMNSEGYPEISFYTTNRGTIELYNESNSGLPSSHILDIETDNRGWIWFGTHGNGAAYFDGTTWTNVNGLPSNYVYSIETDLSGTVWLGTLNGIASFDGTNLQSFTPENSPLPYRQVGEGRIAIDINGDKWFTVNQWNVTDPVGALVKYNGVTWTTYDHTNSPLPDAWMGPIAADPNIGVWLGVGESTLWYFDGVNWTSYESPSYVPDFYNSLLIDINGDKWIGSLGGAIRFDNGVWSVLNASNSDLRTDGIQEIVHDSTGLKWLGTRGDGAYTYDGVSWQEQYITQVRGAVVNTIEFTEDNTRWFGTDGPSAVKQIWGKNYSIDLGQRWIDTSTADASYEFNSLISRGTYSLSIQSAVGIDGMVIAPYGNFTFTVEYAGPIAADQTPPTKPSVLAWSMDESSTITAIWQSEEDAGTIVRYRYAVGTRSGGADIVDWTTTTDKYFTRDNLTLVDGQSYYVSVQACNKGGLWSDIGVSMPVVAGQDPFIIRLPVTLRQ